jgi:hypothetical protein
LGTQEKSKTVASRVYSTDLERVVTRTALIENMLNQVVTNFCAPPETLHRFYWDVILDSSVMSTASKVKVAMAIAQKLRYKLDKNALHRVMALRNAFAHHTVDSFPVFVVARDPDKGSVRYELQVLDNEGRLTRTPRNDAVEQFDTAFEEAKGSIRGLLVAIKEKGPANAA